MRYQLRYVRVGGVTAKHPTIADAAISTQRDPTAAPTRHYGRVLGHPAARLGGLCASELIEVSHDPSVLDGRGRWAVLMPYSGQAVFARFGHWHPGPADPVAGDWIGPQQWSSSMDEVSYCAAVDQIRDQIAQGRVYQANLCRVLTAEMPDPTAVDVGGLHALLDREHPAPFAGMIRLPDHDVHVATASPELFLRRHGDRVESSPIKGTATHAGDLLEKDRAENVMIVDLVRNDLSRVCQPGSVEVAELMATHTHPGLVHLVSTVRGSLAPDTTWDGLLAATFPPGSVTGAPKHTALQVIAEGEPVSRGPYCGAIGWVDADTGDAELAVAIRTFWLTIDDGRHLLHFGTGAGITWGSQPQREWQETQLKAARLTEVAAGQWHPDRVQPTASGRSAAVSVEP